MSQADLADRLNQAIAAARAGRTEEARAILIPLSKQYPAIEQVWMWLASVTEDTQDRVGYLRHVLEINPRNERARQALTRLTGEGPATRAQSPTRSGGTGRPMDTWLIAILALLAIIVLTILISTVIGPLLNPPPPTPTNTQVVPTLTRTNTKPAKSYTPSITPGGPTLTPFMTSTVPPTWTVTFTYTPAPSATPLPSNTPLPPTNTPLPRNTITSVPTITPGGPGIQLRPSQTPRPVSTTPVQTRPTATTPTKP